MKVAYTWEMLFLATVTLACGHESLRIRLEEACLSNVLRLSFTDFPTDDHKERFGMILADIAPPGGDLRETLASYSDNKITQIAELVVSLYDSIARSYTPI